MKMALREKSVLHAQVAGLQKTNHDIARSKNVLQAKVMKHASTVECANDVLYTKMENGPDSLPLKVAHSVDARKATSLQNELESASQQLEMNQKVINTRVHLPVAWIGPAI